MITMQDVESAIAECQGARKLSARSVELLGALYTIKDHMTEPTRGEESYSYAAGPRCEAVRYMSQTPFGRAIYLKPAREIWAIMDDLMSALKSVNPRMYDSVMRQL